MLANLKRPGDNIGDLSSRLFLSVQFPPLIGLATQVSIAVRLLDRSPTLCSVPGNDWGPGWRQDGQRMVCQTAARWCWTCEGKSPSEQISKTSTGNRNSKERGWKGWLNLRRHNWQSAPHLVGKLNSEFLSGWILEYKSGGSHRLLLCSSIARQFIRPRRASRLGLRSCGWRQVLIRSLVVHVHLCWLWRWRLSRSS